jgi:hypothetical protein
LDLLPITGEVFTCFIIIHRITSGNSPLSLA